VKAVITHTTDMTATFLEFWAVVHGVAVAETEEVVGVAVRVVVIVVSLGVAMGELMVNGIEKIL
jgi:hypothetical protein